ncbi:SHOCT domain-containing protein [Proteocatella sphenisci]|uniref:SHOCT domain-containing protein n=1 Tax=Proteocatella sphenisci TaxID=181070 RepID=UPI0004B764DE|nr:SHOCT domain-containing protein [Proteocatella sphenisci]
MNRYWGGGLNDMMNFGSHAAGWFIAFEMIKLLIIVALVIFIAKMFIKNSKNNVDSTPNTSRAIEILKERYASGEITEEEYKIKLNKLRE